MGGTYLCVELGLNEGLGIEDVLAEEVLGQDILVLCREERVGGWVGGLSIWIGR